MKCLRFQELINGATRRLDAATDQAKTEKLDDLIVFCCKINSIEDGQELRNKDRP
jgi:hypothetical protein